MTSDEQAHLEKLEKHKAEIMRLRHLYGKDRGWSAEGLARYFGIPKKIIEPVIGVQRARG